MTPLQPVHARAQAHDDIEQPEQQFSFTGPFFCSREAAAYIPCKTVKAFYEWCRRNGIIRRRNGSIAKVDIDRVLIKHGTTDPCETWAAEEPQKGGER